MQIKAQTKKKKTHTYPNAHISGLTFHMSCDTCPPSHVTCHMTHVTNTNSHSHGPSPYKLFHYAQWHADGDLNLDPSKTVVSTQKLPFFLAAILYHF